MLQNGEPHTKSSGLNWNMEKSTMLVFMKGGNTSQSQSQQVKVNRKTSQAGVSRLRHSLIKIT